MLATDGGSTSMRLAVAAVVGSEMRSATIGVAAEADEYEKESGSGSAVLAGAKPSLSKATQGAAATTGAEATSWVEWRLAKRTTALRM